MDGLIGIVLLAAGASRRLGKPKQLLQYRGTTLLRHVAMEAVSSRADAVTIVLGAGAAAMHSEVADLGVAIAFNEGWSEGMAGSIHTGLADLRGRVSRLGAVVLMLCDQPFADRALLDALIVTHHQTGAPVVASRYGEVLGVPALFEQRLFDRLAALDGNAGARVLIAEHVHEMAQVPFPLGTVDIDTPEDYRQLSDG